MTFKRRTNASPGERDEHAPLLRAAQDLEEAMADPRPHRPHVAQRLLLKRLLVVGDCLRQHCEFTEQRGGTLAELEIEIGHLYQLTAARTEHEQLLALADDLASMLEHADDAAAHSSFETQSRCVRLTETLRVHCVNERDLIQIRPTSMSAFATEGKRHPADEKAMGAIQQKWRERGGPHKARL